MLSGVSITCFAAAYALVLALEIARLMFRSAIPGAMLRGLAAAGLLAHTLFLWNLIRQVDQVLWYNCLAPGGRR